MPSRSFRLQRPPDQLMSKNQNSSYLSLPKSGKNLISYIKSILGDSIYDAEYILDFIIHDLKVKPYLARNLRRSRRSDTKLSKSGGIIYLAGFKMFYWGKFKDRGKTQLKFVCAPLPTPKNLPKKYPNVPGITLNSLMVKIALHT